jgi:hypothetical protein
VDGSGTEGEEDEDIGREGVIGKEETTSTPMVCG